MAQGNRVNGLAERTPFKDTSFDAILMKDALVHIGDIDEFSSEVSRLLVPGGKLLITSFMMGRYQNFFVVHGSKDDTVYFDTPNDYFDKVRLFSNNKIVTISAPYYPKNPTRIHKSLAANNFSLIKTDSWTPHGQSDWYGESGFKRKIFLYEKR